MQLKKGTSMGKAHGVLKSLEKLFDEDLRLMVMHDAQFLVEAYQNGREQGYSILCFYPKGESKCFYIAQSRGSDSIVVYYGSGSNQSISPDAYRNGKYFDEAAFDEAAGYIRDTIIKSYKSVEEFGVA
jgi:hypothetical protein